ncbi:MAG: nucleotide exchange factor GrpE [Microbacterium sp.]|uniref:nucleotide exchange factor GrpE n=1 Tax=Microbacterium sp. TaxID=51671 RepID=UPI003A875CF4
MTDKDEFRPDEEGSAAQAAGPDPQTGGAADAGDDVLTIDDILGETQEPGVAQADEALTGDEDTVDLPPEAAGYLADLKRLTAEYANYRRRTEEQRQIEIERAKGSVATALLPVLDDLDRAQQHGDLTEGSAFAAIAEKIRGVAERTGLVAYGVAGEAFDPQQHEAIFQQPTPDATEPTVLEVVEVGYRLGEVELRPAKVVVAVSSADSGNG